MIELPDYLLAPILDEPQEDAHRLISADWLEEHGEAARAEFIRVQCELAQLPESMDCTDLSASWCPECGDCRCADREERMDDHRCPLHNPTSLHAELEKRRAELWERERELLEAAAVHDWSEFPGYVREWWWRRGFVSVVTLTAADWLTHVSAITRSNPVERVIFTTMPRYESLLLAFSREGRKCRSEFQPRFGYAEGPELALRILNDLWPKIDFVLPPETSKFTYADMTWRPPLKG